MREVCIFLFSTELLLHLHQMQLVTEANRREGYYTSETSSIQTATTVIQPVSQSHVVYQPAPGSVSLRIRFARVCLCGRGFSAGYGAFTGQQQVYYPQAKLPP